MLPLYGICLLLLLHSLEPFSKVILTTEEVITAILKVISATTKNIVLFQKLYSAFFIDQT